METLRSVCQNRFAQILAASIACLYISNKYFESHVPKTQPDKKEPWWLSSIREQGSNPTQSLSSNQNKTNSCTRGVVDLDAFDRNCKKCIRAVIDQNNLEGRTTKEQKKKLRIATKSIRSVYLILRFVKLIVDEDADIFAGLLCFTAHEVFELVKVSLLNENNKYSFKHLLLAYPVGDSLSCQKLIEAQQLANSDSSQNIKISTMIDSERQVQMLLNVWNFANNNNFNNFPTLWIDIDMSWKPLGIQSLHFGARRSALCAKEKVTTLLKKIEQLSLKNNTFNIVDMIEGYQAYESQIAGFPDFVANSSLPCIVRKFLKSCCSNSSAVINRRREILEADENFRQTTATTTKKTSVSMMNDGQVKMNKIEMNGGGSGSIKFSLQDPAVTEITVGSAALCGHQFDGYSQEPLFEPCLFFTLVATRQGTPTIFTCHGGGWIASGDPGWYRLPKIVWPSSSKYLDFEGAGEVQTPIQVSEEDAKRIVEAESLRLLPPTLFVFRPNKSGELGEVFAEYTLVCSQGENDEIDDEGNHLKIIKTYRGSGIHSWS